MIRKFAIILFILWTLGMAFLLLTPGSSIPKVKLFENQDKVAHLVLFTVWCFLLVLVHQKSRMYTLLFVLGVGLLIGGVTEILQAYIPFRTPDINDFYLDLLGIGLGVLLGFLAKKELNGTEKKFDK